ncbi:MAG: transcriptional repressor LexA [Candidatus Zixiibacteriota bacterium]
MVKAKLTARQKQVYDFIAASILEKSAPPTIREIGERFSIQSTNGVRSILTALIKKGYIKKTPLVSRGIELANRMTTSVRQLRLVGAVPAGAPLLADENVEGSIAVDTTFLPSGETYSLRVVGESMIGAGIVDGDFVVVRKQDSADAGDIVVAVIGDEATVKRYYPEPDCIRLEPENDAFGPIIVENDTPGFYIAGKVVGLLRRM